MTAQESGTAVSSADELASPGGAGVERESPSREELSSLFYALGFTVLLIGCVVTQALI